MLLYPRGTAATRHNNEHDGNIANFERDFYGGEKLRFLSFVCIIKIAHKIFVSSSFVKHEVPTVVNGRLITTSLLITMRLCHPPDGSISPKYKLLCFKPP